MSQHATNTHDTADTQATLLRTDALTTWFPQRGGRRAGMVRAVDGVSLSIRRGEILGLVGESGCGKSTFGKTLMGIVPGTSGTIAFDGSDLMRLSSRERRRIRNKLQYVYQDAGASLDPRWTIGQSLEEPLVVHTALSRAERRERAGQTIRDVGLRTEHLDRYPHELSGGQQRRIGLARILTLQPRLVILDEPTSGLDVSVQAMILNLLLALRTEYDLTYLFISHDLAIVRAVCDRVAVMYLGRIVELAATSALFARPRHPYTQSLLASVPQPGRRSLADQPLLEGDPPDAANLPGGCRFRDRCPRAEARCAEHEPELLQAGDSLAACHYPLAMQETR